MVNKPTYEELEKRIQSLKQAKTEHENIEEKLRESEARLAEAQRIAKIGSWEWDIITNKVCASEEVYRIFGFQEQSFNTYEEFLNVVHPNDREMVQASVKEALRLNKPYSIDHRMVLPSGEVIVVHEQGEVTLDDSGEPVRLNGIVQDITDRRRTEEKLHDSEANLKSTVDISPSIVSKANIDTGYFVEVSPLVTKILGFSVEEFTSKPFIEFIHPDDRQRTLDEVSEQLKGKEVAFFENRYLCKDGSYKWMAWQGTPADENGIVTAIGSNINARKRAEKALRGSEKKYRTLFENMAQGVFYQKSDGEIVDANPAALDLFGLTLDEFLGRTSRDPRWKVIHEDGSDFPGEDHPSMVALRTGKPVRDVVAGVYNPREDDYTWIHINAIPLFTIGESKADQVFVTIHDISERKKAERHAWEKEEALRLSLAAAKAGTWTWDIKTGEVVWDDQMQKIFGLEAGTFKGTFEAWKERVHPDDIGAAERITLDALERGERYEFEYRVKGQSGEWNIINAQASVMKDVSGKPTRMSGFAMDITSRKQAEEVLRESERKYRYLYETMAQGIVLQDNQGRILEANRAAQEILGLSMDQMLGRTPYDPRWKLIQEDGSPYNPDEMPSNIALRTGKPTKDVFCGVYVPEQDKYRWIIINSAPRFRDGETTPFLTMTVFTDITERKMAEEELRKSESKYRQVFETNKAVKLMINPEDGAILEANAAACNFYGYSKREITTMKITDINALPPEKTYLEMQKAKSEERLFFRFSHRLASGEVRDVEVYSGPVNLGETSILHSIIHDVTDRLNAEKALAKQKEFLQKAQEIGHVGTWELDTLKNELLWTDENYRIFGLPMGTKLTYETFLDCVHPDDREYVDNEWKAAFDKKPYDIEHRLLVDGHVKWVREKAELHFDETGNCIRGTGFTQDITDRKQAEEALQTREKFFNRVIDQSPFAIWISDPEGTLQLVNPALKRFLNLTDEQLVGKYNMLKDPLAEKQGLMPLIRTVYEEGKTISFTADWNGEDIPTMDLKGSNSVSVEATMFPIHGPEDELTNVVLNWIDITEKRRLEAQLQQAQKMEAIGTLAGGIAHDFNNILGIILGNAELAMEDLPEWNPARGNLDEVRKACMRAKDVVRQILSFSRKSESEQKPMNIASVVAESLKLLRASIPTSIDIHQSISTDIDHIHGDPTQIHQIMINLCTNAAHAMEDAGGVLEVNLQNEELKTKCETFHLEPGKYVKLSVRDTGDGIPSEVIDRIFDPYFTTKDVGKGTGLGLSVVHGIVNGHKGRISVESDAGKGTTFNLLFPAVERHMPQKPKKLEDLPTGEERILFVDDEDAMVHLNQQRLEKLGYQVIPKTDPSEALEYLRTSPDQVDLIITDMTMPKMTGDRLAQEILKITPHMPIILCTGYSNRISEERAQELGIRKYIEKPIEMEILARSVREVLDGK